MGDSKKVIEWQNSNKYAVTRLVVANIQQVKHIAQKNVVRRVEMLNSSMYKQDSEEFVGRESDVFETDHRKSNPGLHLLYVKWATKHLKLLDNILTVLHAQSNGNMLDTIIAVNEEREKLIKKNAAFADAQEILEEIKKANKLNELLMV